MKFRHLVFIFIALVILIAWLTRPGMDDFKAFYEGEQAAVATPPLITEQNSVVYSRYTVSHYNIQSLPKSKIDGESGAVAVPAQKSVYIGLFGRFWKMD